MIEANSPPDTRVLYVMGSEMGSEKNMRGAGEQCRPCLDLLTQRLDRPGAPTPTEAGLIKATSVLTLASQMVPHLRRHCAFAEWSFWERCYFANVCAMGAVTNPSDWKKQTAAPGSSHVLAPSAKSLKLRLGRVCRKTHLLSP